MNLLRPAAGSSAPFITPRRTWAGGETMRTALALSIALLLAAPALALPLPTRDAAPEGCAEENGAYHCAWSVDTRDPAVLGQGATPTFRQEIPLHNNTLATITVRLEGEDRGWNLIIVRWPDGDREGAAEIESIARHAAPFDGQLFHAETSTHVLRGDGRDLHELVLTFSDYNVGGTEAYGTGPPSLGEFHVAYLAEELPAGVPPSRPAASKEDPHLADAADDARRPELDVLAAWLDDARLGDGLLDIHLAVADLGDPSFDADVSVGGSSLTWEALFRVEPEQYRMIWFLHPDGSLSCNLRRDTVTATSIVAVPDCSLDEADATLSAIFPEGAIGNPRAGTPIRLVGASAHTFSGVRQTEDLASEARYDFAPGGPSVWSGLNPRLDPPPAEPKAWYVDPIARENLPDTLQVVGAILAATTFIGGLVVVHRSRRQTRTLLAQVDLLVRQHQENAREALLALGRLESQFDDLYRGGRINESQYQLASSRITSAAARFALRRELGLDDGAPGDEPARRVPVRGPEAEQAEKQ